MPLSDDAPTASLNGQPATTTPLANQPATTPATAAHDTPPDAFEAWVAGSSADRYRPADDDLYRTGGLGQVFKVRDPVVGRVVAVKRLRADRGGAALQARFVREAEITGRLEHPNIVPLYDLLAGDDGPAYVMRFVDGETLAEAARGYHKRTAKKQAGPLELPRLLGAVVLVCEAVGYAHGKGVLHRDLKGQNVLLGQFGEVCLADWGLAKVVGEPDRPGDPTPLSPSLGDLTQPGSLMGTPQFMAPELARAEPASHATDIYALGAMLYQVLTDRVPHAGTTPEEVLSSLKAGNPVPPVRQVNPGVPAALAAICHKALSDQPADRYESARGLADDLRAHLAGEPVGAYPEPLADRLWRRVKRHRAKALAAAVGLAVAAAGATAGAILLYQEKERTAERGREAEAAWAEAEERKGQAEAARADEERAKRRAEDKQAEAEANLRVSLAVADNLFKVVSGTETATPGGSVAERRQAIKEAVTAYEQLTRAQPDQLAHRLRLGRLLRFAGNLARLTNDRAAADAAFAGAVGHLRTLAVQTPADTDRQVELAHGLGEAAAHRAVYGDLAGAGGYLDEAAGLLDGLPGSGRTAAHVWVNRALVDTLVGRFDPAADAARRAARAFAAGTGHPHDPVFHGLAVLAEADARREQVRAGGGDYRAALAIYDEAVELLDQTSGRYPHRDARHTLYRALAGRAETRLLAGGPAADALADAERAVVGWQALAVLDPEVAAYRRELACGLLIRADAQVAVAGAGSRPPKAVDDVTAATRHVERLAKADQQRPDYRQLLAECWTRQARLATAAAERNTAYQKAGSSARMGSKLCPDNTLYRTVYRALEREAATAGAPLVVPPPPPGR